MPEILILRLLKIVINMILQNVENEYFLRRVWLQNSLCRQKLLADSSSMNNLCGNRQGRGKKVTSNKEKELMGFHLLFFEKKSFLHLQNF